MYITIKDITGEVYTSDSVTRDELIEYMGSEGEMLAGIRETREAFKNFNEIDNLSMFIDGKSVSFNPAHIVTLTFHGLEEFGLDD